MRKFKLVRSTPKAALAASITSNVTDALLSLKRQGKLKVVTKRLNLEPSQADNGAAHYRVVKNAAGQVIDYLDVTFRGYLSTFGTVDRDGDYVLPGAFKASIPKFMDNPVLLADHENRVGCIAGKFTKVLEDAKGLYVEAVLSNSSEEWLIDLRWKVVELHISALSVGGKFSYGRDGHAITKVELYEGSLVPIPANPKALLIHD